MAKVTSMEAEKKKKIDKEIREGLKALDELNKLAEEGKITPEEWGQLFWERCMSKSRARKLAEVERTGKTGWEEKRKVVNLQDEKDFREFRQKIME